MKSAVVLSNIAFIATLLFWGTLIIAWLYASFFVSNKAAPISIMSPRTLFQLYLLSLSWLVSPLIEIFAIMAFLKGEKNMKTIMALALNAMPIFLLILVFVIQKGNIIYGCKEIIRFVLSPLRW